MNQRNGFDPLHRLDQMASLISEVTGEPVDTVVNRIELEQSHPGRSVAVDFASHGGPRYVWGKHLEDFYGKTNAFLYELVVWNRNALKSRMRRWVTRHMAAHKRPLNILSIGDGLGFDCLHFLRKGHHVTYFELPGLSESFARRLFERSGADVPMLNDPSAIPKESFDVITCFDVLEHVPRPHELVKSLAAHLRPGGVMYVSAPFFMILPWYPTHLRENRRFSGSTWLYRQAGLRLIDGEFTWFPLVLQKPGAQCPPVSRTGALLARLTAPIQAIGRLSAWPFLPVHFLRLLNNRPFRAGNLHGR